MAERNLIPPDSIGKDSKSNGLPRFLKELGPGITGAADDDPSGISTYSVAGASYGYTTLRTALLSFPLMASVQFMCEAGHGYRRWSSQCDSFTAKVGTRSNAFFHTHSLISQPSLTFNDLGPLFVAYR